MEKLGEVRQGLTPCDLCGAPALYISDTDKTARCKDHFSSDSEKTAEVTVTSIRSFTEPLDSTESD